jgi:gamma-glutamyltranspeptidase/glutathione hydrolase
MVVTGSPYATEAGVRMLEAGGNAMDAAVAAAFALAVAEPTQSGLGGRSQLIVREASGAVHSIDGTTQVPRRYDRETAPVGEHGHAAVGVPGSVAALTRALAEHGSLSLATVMEPAIAWARAGVVPPAGEQDRILELIADVGDESVVARNLRLVDDGEGQRRLVQPVLAQTLEMISRQGADAFYRGSLARAIAADMAANGGYVSLADLAEYYAVDAEVGRVRYGGYEVLGSYLPASGVTTAQILRVLDRIGVAEVGEATWAATVAEALLVGFEDREIAERMAPRRAVAWLTSDSLADRRAADVRARVADPALRGARDSDDDVAEPAFTSHVSVVDAAGMAVALTQSLGPTGGARVMTPGLGFLYASTMGGYLLGGGPGYRPWSSQAPLIVVDERGPVLVMGGAGGRRIVSAMVSTLSRIVDRGLDLESAVRAPRLHPTGGAIRLDEEWDVREALRAMGYRVERTDAGYFGRLNSVQLSGRRAFGVADPGWSGASSSGPR